MSNSSDTRVMLHFRIFIVDNSMNLIHPTCSHVFVQVSYT
uniref:Uncharacterized protein n=1 Tax=Rhizophora mucronata TaxID=61149 RepID=A0A2P2JGH0_RHIMU